METAAAGRPPQATQGWTFLRILLRQVDRDRVLVRAAGLAYTTLIATVPLVTVLFSLFSAFGALDDLKARVKVFLFGQFLPARQDELIGYFDQITENTGRVGFVGSAVLIVTAALLLHSVELNFNDIWRSRSRRTLVNKVTSYTAVLVLGPLFLGASLTLSARLEALLFGGMELNRGVLQKLGDLALPYVLTLAGLIMLYAVVPFARVKWRSALLGAATSGVLWELAKHFFTDLASQSIGASKLYGSLAVIPIFIVWLYITWVIVLIGLEVSYTHHHYRSLARELDHPTQHREGRHVLALRMFGHIAREFDRGAEPPTLEELANRADMTLDSANEILGRFEQAKLVHQVAVGRRDAEGYVPAISPTNLPVYSVIAPFLRTGKATRSPGDPLDEVARKLSQRFTQAGQEALGRATVDDLFSSGKEPGDDPSSAVESG